MLIETYFLRLRDVIEARTLVRDFTLVPDFRDDYEGFMRGEIKFVDDSVLYLREFVDVATTIERKMYSYQYMNALNILIFRYDNTRHHRKLNLPNYPHHKHEGSQDNILPSDAPMLADVLNEIERLLTQ